MSDVQTQHGGWKQTTPVIPQDQVDNCGAATAAMLVRTQGGGVGKTDSELMAELENKYTDGKGTTPEQLGNMLAGEGFQVTHGADQFDHWGLDGALKKGRKVLAQVDSNAVLPGKGDQKPGSSHWVEIDGMDQNGNYLVKDPARGTRYYVPLDDLRGAMNAGKGPGGGSRGSAFGRESGS